MENPILEAQSQESQGCEVDDEDICFGKSMFKNKTGWKIEFYRWMVQLIALLRKNALVLSRRPFQVIFFVSLPSTILFTFLLKEKDTEYCGEPGLNLDILGTVLPYVSTSVFLIMSFFSFSFVGEERYKHLFTYLRRLGLYDSAYWCSWLIVFQVLIIASCIVAMPIMAIVRTSSDSLARIDYGMIFLIFWASASGMTANGFFLATLCKSQQSTSTYTLLNLLLALLVMIICTTLGGLNSYTGGEVFCYFETSSYNKVYSVAGSELVVFIVWFMPWFHSAQALSDVVSLVQIKSVHVNAYTSDFNGPNAAMLFTNKLSDGESFFDSEWIGFALWMLFTNVFVYVFLAWLTGLLLSTDETEGRSLVSILFPLSVRKYFTKPDEDAVLHGDVRQGEQVQSEAEGSVRAYKVSKTFKETQALKEVTFNLQRGSVFVLLGHNGAGMM
jgi:ABC-type multidrug transport system fused ATPase/permease subunit